MNARGLKPLLLRLASLAARPCCPLCGESEEGDPLCTWCSIRLYPNIFSHWSGDGRAALEGMPGNGVLIESPFAHSGAAREMVHLLKFRGRRSLGRVAARLIAGSGCRLPMPGDLVVPMPLGRSRSRSRGYNQSRLIAAHLSRIRGVRCADLLRREDRPPQVGLPAERRRTNLRGAFSVSGRPVPRGPTCWIVDDVATTGATLHEAAGALLEAGATDVKGLTLTYRKLRPGCIIDEEEITGEI